MDKDHILRRILRDSVNHLDIEDRTVLASGASSAIAEAIAKSNSQIIMSIANDMQVDAVILLAEVGPKIATAMIRATMLNVLAHMDDDATNEEAEDMLESLRGYLESATQLKGTPREVMKQCRADILNETLKESKKGRMQ
ncbi:MAG: hypothetical protein GKR86_01020 [Ilumatobacter sp.]|nr:hypothetical protein [Ilumatobacter sp.]